MQEQGVHTWHCRRQQLEQVVPEVEFVACHKEAGPEEQGSPQAQKNLIGQCIFCSAPPLQSDSLCCKTRWEKLPKGMLVFVFQSKSLCCESQQKI